MIRKRKLSLFLLLALLAACVTTPVSQKSALILVPMSQEVSLGAQAYQDVLKKEKESTDARLVAIVERVGRRIAAVSAMPRLDWEFKLIESDQQNAFALPGGKTAVYTGILPVCQNEAGLAAVVSHEIAHVIARHGAQRMSQQLLATGALAAASVSLSKSKNRKGILAALGLGVTYGVMLPYSRSHESEADQIGLVYMAKAGYDPREAFRFWRRFSEMKGGGQPPEFLSTHPSDNTRVRAMETYLHRAMTEYQRAPRQYGIGASFNLAPKGKTNGSPPVSRTTPPLGGSFSTRPR